MNDARIKQWIQSLGRLDGCLIESPIDLLYLTGLPLSKGRLLATQATQAGATLFVDGRYFAIAQKKAPCPVVLSEEKAFREAFGKGKKIGFDSAFLSYDGYTSLCKSFPHVEWVPTPNPTRLLRLLKEPQEIAALKRAAQLTWEGYRHVLGFLKEGVSEEEIALEFEIFCRKKGASGFSFDAIIAFGENSAYPHHRAGKSRLQKNQVVLIDVGAIVDGYCGDMTRIFFFGEPDPRLSRFYRLVHGAQQKAVAHVRPGVHLGTLDQIVRDEFRKEGVEELYVHTLGHGVGLETHEYPRIKFDNEDKDLILKPGMVFTIEPGLYQPGVGGIRYEDTVLVTPTGCENFYPM